MSIKQRRPSASNLHHIPSTSFSTFSSAASTTSVGTSRSGGSRLLFGEIDLTSDRSSETVASVCSLVLSDSSTFLKFWLTDRCREQLISSLPKPDLANLRLVCHDFSARAAPTLFQDLSITFKPNTFTRPARLAALDRVGYHVKHLTFKVPHTPETLLPPLIHPETGEELNFTYKPQTEAGPSQAKYDDEDITELLAYQYTPLFHAATNVPAFIRGLSSFPGLTHLEISCPGAISSSHSRRSTVDYALISLRIAIERNHFNALDTLTLSPIHPTGLLALSPLTSCGASPSSAKRWTCIQHLSIDTQGLSPSRSQDSQHQDDPNKLLTSYLSTFQASLVSLRFAWLGLKGPLPFHQTNSPATPQSHHPAHHRRKLREHPTRLFFSRIQTICLENATANASHIRKLAIQHAATLQTFELTDVELIEGTWEEAFAPLVEPSEAAAPSTPSPRARPSQHRLRTPKIDSVEMADIPIMFTPPRSITTTKLLPSQRPSHPCLRDVHPSARLQEPFQTPVRERVHPAHQHTHQHHELRHQRTGMKHPPPTPLLSPMPKKLKRFEAPVQPVRKVGILGRVARGVKRTFGG